MARKHPLLKWGIYMQAPPPPPPSPLFRLIIIFDKLMIVFGILKIVFGKLIDDFFCCS
jgi:hypothetical protein